MKLSHLIFGLLCFIIILFIGRGISAFPVKFSVILAIFFVVSVLTLINLEIGLYILIFVIPFTQQFTLARIAHGPVDLGTDDVLIIFILFSWLMNLIRRKEPFFLKTSLNWPLFAFFTAGVFSYIGADPRLGAGNIVIGIFHLFKFFEYVAIYFIVISTIRSFEQIKKFILMFFIVAGFILIVQFIAMLMTGSFGISAAAVNPSSFYIKTMHSFVSNAVLGAYYSFFLSILLAFILQSSASRGKVFLILFAGIISYALFNTFSRSAYLGTVAAFIILAIFKEKRLFLIILLLVVFSPIYMQSAVLERITLTLSVKQSISLDYSSSIRLVLWKKALGLFLTRPFFGMGFWTTRNVMLYEAHSQYIAILAETGIVGFFVFCWLIIRLIKNSLTLIKRADTIFFRSLGIGYLAGLAAILTTCIFSETLEAFQMVGPLWFVTGLVTSANRLLLEKSKKLDIDST